jgi:cytochrome c
MLTGLNLKQFITFSSGVITLTLSLTLLFNLLFIHDSEQDTRQTNQVKPDVSIDIPADSSSYSWGSQVRYSISVSDEMDGDSRFGEINPNNVLLEVEFLNRQSDQINNVRSSYNTTDEHIGLTLIRKFDCFSCHADKVALVGPSFSDMSKKYEPDSSTLQQLGEHITEGSSGIWGEFLMPPNESITPDEAMEMADYILKQGNREDRWVYTGIEGMFRIIEKPEYVESGIYRLTASYINSGTDEESGSGIRGEQTIFLLIE